MSYNRDKQFINFANALYMECMNVYQEALIKGDIGADQRVIQHMARRAYDLACDIIGQLDSGVAWRIEQGHDASEIIESDIADMPKLPKEQK